ncbi:MAG TPA: hypothetical protein VN903_34115 [Polyangia bacterium]|jgi:hypothetical protein|nr:hypothetical protein [Polyangia bacterium]
MSPRLPVFALFAALVCVAANSWAKTDKKFATWLGRTTVQVLEAADRVEIFVVGPQPVGPRAKADDTAGNKLPPEAPQTIRRYPVRQVAAGQGRAFAQQIARLVLDERSYEPQMYPFGRSVMKACTFAPGVAFRLWARSRAVDVLLSFRCDEIAVAYVNGKREPLAGDIDPARAAFVQLAKSVLGDVPEIAQLPAARPE